MLQYQQIMSCMHIKAMPMQKNKPNQNKCDLIGCTEMHKIIVYVYVNVLTVQEM